MNKYISILQGEVSEFDWEGLPSYNRPEATGEEILKEAQNILDWHIAQVEYKQKELEKYKKGEHSEVGIHVATLRIDHLQEQIESMDSDIRLYIRELKRMGEL